MNENIGHGLNYTQYSEHTTAHSSPYFERDGGGDDIGAVDGGVATAMLLR